MISFNFLNAFYVLTPNIFFNILEFTIRFSDEFIYNPPSPLKKKIKKSKNIVINIPKKINILSNTLIFSKRI